MWMTATSAIAQSADGKLEAVSQRMNAPLWTPGDMSDLSLGCSNPIASTKGSYLTAQQIDYQNAGWEQRVQGDWGFFASPEVSGRILVIDTDTSGKVPAYRYLSNGTQDQLFEPWSASKVLAYTGAMAALRRQLEAGGDGYLGQYNIADLITSIHSYAPHGTADGDSNAIASYFVNLAGRDNLTRLMHKNWLNLANGHVMFRGAYGTELLKPHLPEWRDNPQGPALPYSLFEQNEQDPGYLPYRCDNCGLTGNKSMTTLAMAEWLKRLAMHAEEPSTRHPYLKPEDLEVLFFGRGHTDPNLPTAGMMRGISFQLGLAIARALAQNPQLSDEQAATVLDEASDGKWRIYQKIGWGPSETRGTGENVMLAQVCLPLKSRTASFTLAAQASHPGTTDESVLHSGEKMQQLLDDAMVRLLAPGAGR